MLKKEDIERFYKDVLILNLKFPVAAISAATGQSKSNVSKYLRKKLEPSESFLNKFYEAFPKGGKNVSHETFVEEPEPYYKKRLALKNGQHQGIPIYEAAPVTLGNIQTYRDQQPDGPDFWVTIPQLRDCNYGCRAKGDSMHPLIRTNALVIGKEITDLSVVVFGEVYIVKTKNGIETVKYIHPVESDPESILLVPYNEKAKITPIHKSDILKLYEAKAVFNTL